MNFGSFLFDFLNSAKEKWAIVYQFPILLMKLLLHKISKVETYLSVLCGLKPHHETHSCESYTQERLCH